MRWETPSESEGAALCIDMIVGGIVSVSLVVMNCTHNAFCSRGLQETYRHSSLAPRRFGGRNGRGLIEFLLGIGDSVLEVVKVLFPAGIHRVGIAEVVLVHLFGVDGRCARQEGLGFVLHGSGAQHAQRGRAHAPREQHGTAQQSLRGHGSLQWREEQSK